MNQVVQLRKAGISMERVAEQVGISKTQVHRLEQLALAQYNTNSEEETNRWRSLQVARCESLIQGQWSKAIAGNVGASQQVLKAMEFQAKLLGLNAPVKVAPTNPDGTEEWSGGGGLAALLAESKKRNDGGEGK
jgi:hypothetical protein